jgi:hypothetical protein
MANKFQNFMRRVTYNSVLQREMCVNNKINYIQNKSSLNRATPILSADFYNYTAEHLKRNAPKGRLFKTLAVT